MGKKQKDNQLQAKLADVESQLKRALADYQNLEKRVAEGRSELTNFVGGELIKKLLPVLDHFETVVEKGRPVLSDPPAGGESKEWFRGVELAVKEFKQILAQEGLEEIPADPSTSLGAGGQFDPALHEAVDTKEGEDNKILEVVRKGYTLNGKVLRPAQVVVGKSQVDGMSQEQEEKTVDTGDYA